MAWIPTTLIVALILTTGCSASSSSESPTATSEIIETSNDSSSVVTPETPLTSANTILETSSNIPNNESEISSISPSSPTTSQPFNETLSTVTHDTLSESQISTADPSDVITASFDAAIVLSTLSDTTLTPTANVTVIATNSPATSASVSETTYVFVEEETVTSSSQLPLHTTVSTESVSSNNLVDTSSTLMSSLSEDEEFTLTLQPQTDTTTSPSNTKLSSCRVTTFYSETQSRISFTNLSTSSLGQSSISTFNVNYNIDDSSVQSTEGYDFISPSFSPLDPSVTYEQVSELTEQLSTSSAYVETYSSVEAEDQTATSSSDIVTNSPTTFIAENVTENILEHDTDYNLNKSQILEIKFEGDCAKLKKDQSLLFVFSGKLLQHLSTGFNLSKRHIKVGSLNCHPMQLNIMLKKINKRTVQHALDQKLNNVTLFVEDGEDVLYYRITNVRIYLLENVWVNDDILANLQTVDVVVLSVVSLLFVFLCIVGVLFLCRECYRRQRGASFRLKDSPLVNFKMADFTLIKIPRPRMVYNGNTVQESKTRADSLYNNNETPPRALDSNMNDTESSDTSKEHIRVHRIDHKGGLLVGVSRYSIPPIIDDPSKHLIEGQDAETAAGTDNPAYTGEDVPGQMGREKQFEEIELTI